jgi:glycerol-3-phosphate O-acyltransferase / dihydroxyacetone phosphate acyltransferase
MRLSSQIPIKRPMDFRRAGQGQLRILDATVFGFGTVFTQDFRPNDYLVVNGIEYKIKSIENDQEMKLYRPSRLDENVSFSVYPRQDNSECIEAVLERLDQGGLIGLFPEGETHETPKLMEMKAGVVSIVLKYLESHESITLQCYSFVFSHPAKYRSKLELIMGEKWVLGKEILKMTKEESYAMIMDRLVEVKEK